MAENVTGFTPDLSEAESKNSVVEREIDVVSNEKRQNENRPFGQSNGMMLKQFYPEGHPYRWPVIGSIADLHGATVDDIKQFYRKYYAPNNATLVVAGDFDRREVRAIKAKETTTITIRQTLVTSVKIEKSQETKEHDDVKVIIVLVPRG